MPVLSNLRRIVLTQLAKAWRFDLGVPASRLVTVFNLNGLLAYRFLGELESEGVAERTGRGKWKLRDTSKARSLSEYALGLWTEECRRKPLTYQYFCENVPDVYYYKPDLPTTWFGSVEYTLVVVDPVLRDRVNPPGEYRFIYVSLRGRRFKFREQFMIPVGTREQSTADFLSYDPYYPVEQYILWYYGDFNLDEVARRCTAQGLRRLSTFLSFMRMAVGKPRATSFNYLSLLDEEMYRRYMSEYFTWVFANGVAEAKNI